MRDTDGYTADARGSNGIALEAQATKVANAANKTAGNQTLDAIDISGAQKSQRDISKNQAMRAELDEVPRPLKQLLGEVLDP